MIKKQPLHSTAQDKKELPLYQPPVIITYSEADLLAVLGPAQAGSRPGDDILGDALGPFGLPKV